MKWTLRILMLIGLWILAIAGYAIATARGSTRPVGFQIAQVIDVQGRPMSIGLWYPTSASPRPTTLIGSTLLKVAPDGPVQGQKLPLVVLSHGNGGSLASHVDLAMDLAGAGYVVAAPTHAGDSFADQSAGGSANLYSGRAQQIRATLDHVLERWNGRNHIDSDRVGAYGLSAGAFTVLTLIGGQPDMTLIASHCVANPEFICKVLQHAGSELLDRNMAADTFVTDHRIKAAVVAAPGLGFTFSNNGLAGVRVSVQLWVGGRDDIVPFATNGRIVRDGLGHRVEFHEARDARHISFLAPCGLLKPPAICADAPGFDRAAFHSTMNAQLIRFFGSHLRSQHS
ncbi:MAG TPA: hypothetical protein PLC64_15170 [Steroidobacteraceae bacterium]|nr:hypothetical protein [Steroidobacteraceae bacterium]HQX80046.1 hypothetical protein [Steroidobacteraceae bacterium]